jgi:uncharacterized protein YggE
MRKSSFCLLAVFIASLMLAIFMAGPDLCRGQVGGNLAFSQPGKKRHVQSAQENPPTVTSMFVHADVLMNVKADEYVVVFGIAQEAETVAECSQRMDAVVKEFAEALKALKVSEEDIYVDFVTQTKIYGYEVAGTIAREKLVGFELKKNLIVHYKDRALLDKFVVAAARAKIYDLIKVDYIVRDVNLVQDKLMEEAGRVVKQKLARYEKLLGIKVHPGQVYAEKPAIYYPTGMYDQFTAAESEAIENPPKGQKYTIVSARKSRTFVYNGLDGDGFDKVINPVIIEPVVQFTLHLKVKYEVEQVKAK